MAAASSTIFYLGSRDFSAPRSASPSRPATARSTPVTAATRPGRHRAGTYACRTVDQGVWVRTRAVVAGGVGPRRPRRGRDLDRHPAGRRTAAVSPWPAGPARCRRTAGSRWTPTRWPTRRPSPAIGIRRNVPERAVVVALATACRSRGWRTSPAATATRSACSSSGRARAGARRSRSATRGTRPASSTTACKKVRGWEEMRVTDAAQAVQRRRLPGGVREVGRRGRGAGRALLGRGHRRGRLHGAPATPAMRGAAAAAALTRGLVGWTGAGWTRRRRPT